MRSLRLEPYTWNIVRELFMELLCVPKSSLEDPSLRNRSDFQGSRTFCVLDGLGDCEGNTGYWVEGDESDLVGFLDEYIDEFCVYDDSSSC